MLLGREEADVSLRPWISTSSLRQEGSAVLPTTVLSPFPPSFVAFAVSLEEAKGKLEFSH